MIDEYGNYKYVKTGSVRSYAQWVSWMRNLIETNCYLVAMDHLDSAIRNGHFESVTTNEDLT